MRDPARIGRILQKLYQVWLAYPDQRLGQLYANLTGHHRDVFYIEDDEVETTLDDWIAIIQGEKEDPREQFRQACADTVAALHKDRQRHEPR